MKESLFSYLVSYVPTDKREAKEDYLTQIFAWILANVENAANIYVKYLCEKGNIPYRCCNRRFNADCCAKRPH